jgi:hypothetical protein
MKRNLITNHCSNLSLCDRSTSLLQILRPSEPRPVEFRISLIDPFTILVLKCALLFTSQRRQWSANNGTADQIAWDGIL